MASLDERGLASTDLALGKGHFEVLADLFEQLALQITDTPTQGSDLVDASVTVEVAHELQDSLQEAGAFAILAGAGKTTQLLIGGGKHLETLESGHRQSQVTLGAIESLNIGGHGSDVLLGLDGA